MGWRFRRSIKLVPGVRLNVGKHGFTSVSIGGRGATVNVGKRGVTTTVGIPGTGLSYQHRSAPIVGPAPGAIPSIPAAPVANTTVNAGAGVFHGVCVLIAFATVIGFLTFLSRTNVPGPLAGSSPDAAATATSVQPGQMQSTSVPISTAQAANSVPGSATTGEGDSRTIPDTRQQAIVLQTANVRSAPSMAGTVLRTLPKDSVVLVSKSEGNWLQIQARDGSLVGWIYAPLLKVDSACTTC